MDVVLQLVVFLVGRIAIFSQFNEQLRRALAMLCSGAAVLVYLGVCRAGGRLEAPLKLVARELPVLGAGLIALLVVQTIAFALNDSGIIIPAIAATLALPLVVATFGRVAEVSAVDRPGQSASSAR